MDSAGLVAGLMAAKTAQMQMAVAASIMKTSPDSGATAVSLLSAAEENGKKLAAAAQGLGQNVDISA